jgi:hypothetical protein
MLIYAFILCAFVVLTYLIQFQAYSRHIDADAGDSFYTSIGLPIGNIFDYELTEEEQLAG